MIEAFKIAANLTVTGDATKKMMEFNEAVIKAGSSTTKFLEKMKLLNTSMKLFSEIMKPLKGSFTSFSESIGMAETKIRSFKHQADTTKSSLRSLASAGHEAAGALNMRGVGIGRRIMSGKGNFISAAGAGFAGGLGLYNPAMMAGVAAAGAGIGGFKAYSSFQTQTNQIAGQGFSQADVARGVAAARGMKIPGISQNEMLTAVVDIANATGSMDQAVKYAPQLAKASVANKINMGKTFNASQEASMIQFAELRGGSDPAKVMKALDLAQQAYSATGGRIQPRDLLNLSRMAITAGYRLSDRGLLQMLPTQQELGGFRTGTGIQAGYNRLVAGVGLLRNKKVVKEGQRIGLLNDKGVMPQNYVDLFETSQQDFLEQVLKPLYKKAGITSVSATNREDAFLLGQTYSRFVGAERKNSEKSDRMLPLHENAWGIDSAFFKSLDTNAGEMKKFTSSFENFEIALGKASSGPVRDSLMYLTKFFESLSEWIPKFVDKAKAIRAFDAPGREKAQGIHDLIADKLRPIGENLFGNPVRGAGGNLKDMLHHPVTISIDGHRLAAVLSKTLTTSAQSQVNHGITGADMSRIPTSVGLSYSPGSLSR